MYSSWDAFYHGELQGLWGLIVVPALFLLVRPWRRPRAAGADPRAAGFVCAWATIFALQTIECRKVARAFLDVARAGAAGLRKGEIEGGRQVPWRAVGLGGAGEERRREFIQAGRSCCAA